MALFSKVFAVSLLFLPALTGRAGAVCPSTAAPIGVFSVPSGAAVLIDGKKVGETPFKGTTAVERSQRTRTAPYHPVLSVLGGFVSGGLGAIIGLAGGDPVGETVKGARSGATKDIVECVNARTEHAVRIEKDGISFSRTVAGTDGFGAVSADLSAIAFSLAEEPFRAGKFEKARPLYATVVAFGAKEEAAARKRIEEIDAEFAARKSRAEREAAGKKKAEEAASHLARAEGLFAKRLYYPAVLEAREALRREDDPSTRAFLARVIGTHKGAAAKPGDAGYDEWVRGRAEEAAGSAEAAARHFENAVGAEKEDPVYRNWLGAAHFELGRYATARRHLEKAFELDPEIAWTDFLGRAELELAWRAADDSERAAAAAAAKEAFETALAAGRRKKWTELMRRALPMIPGLPSGMKKLYAARQAGRLDEALAGLDALASAYPFAGAAALRAELLRERDQAERRRRENLRRAAAIAAASLAMAAAVWGNSRSRARF